MNATTSYILSKKFTEETASEFGALKGASAQIQSIVPITGGNRITFEWVNSAGETRTSTLDVINGNDGLGIKSVTINASNHLIITYDDDTTEDAGEVSTVKGEKGEKGEKGDTGVGLPEGGTAGQTLIKKSNKDYDMEWGTPAGSGDMLKSVYDTDNDGKVDSAENADTVDGHTVEKDVPADAKFTDTVYDDTEIRGQIADKVDKVSGKGLSTEDYTSEEKTKLAGIETSAEVNAIESITLNGTEVTPDANKNVALTVITNAVNDLVNYYLKSETYTKTEVDGIVTAIKNSRFEVVATLPTTDIKTNVIYLVPKSPSQTSNVKDEYINLDGTTAGWEKIGDTEIDLSNYVTTQALNTALADYTTTADLTTLLAAKQDTLTFDNAPTENSNNPVKSDGIYAANQNIYEVMGQNSAKNFIPFDLDKIKAKNTTGTWNGNVYSVNGIDFTFNSDGTVDASGTATETASVHYYDPVGLPPFGGDRILRLTGCPSGGSGTTYKVMAYRANEVDGSTGTAEEYGDGINLKWLNNGSGIKAFVSISVYTGAGTIDITFKPMLRLSTDTDNTFAPYAKTNQELTAETQALTNEVKDMNNVYGAKNLLPCPYYDGYGVTSFGITFVVNDDGSITANGTNAGNSRSFFSLARPMTLKKGTYVISKGTTITGTNMRVLKAEDTSRIILISDSQSYGTFILSEDLSVYIQIHSSDATTFNNVTFYPMLCLASVFDKTYAPPSKTNQQLTEDKAEQAEVNDIVNVYGSKNLLPFNVADIIANNTNGTWSGKTYTHRGVTFTLNDDGSITANRTATDSNNCYVPLCLVKVDDVIDRNKAYTLSVNDSDVGCGIGIIPCSESGASIGISEWSTYTHTDFVYSEHDTENTSEYMIIRLRVSTSKTPTNATVYPMLCLKSVYDLDNTYEPYAKTNKQLTEDTTALLDNLEVNGAVNILDSAIATQTVNDITVTNNGDGSYTVNCSSTEHNSANFISTKKVTLPKGTYKWTASADGKSPIGSSDCYAFIRGVNGTSDWYRSYQATYGYGIITLTQESEIEFGLNVAANATVSNLTFKPMITVPSYNGDYVPYAKSNKELTEIVDRNVLVQSSYSLSAGNTWEYTGISFTLTESTLVCIDSNNAYSAVTGLSVGQSSTNRSSHMYQDAYDTDTARKQLVLYLPPATYYIWAKTAGANLTNQITVTKLLG